MCQKETNNNKNTARLAEFYKIFNHMQVPVGSRACHAKWPLKIQDGENIFSLCAFSSPRSRPPFAYNEEIIYLRPETNPERLKALVNSI